MDGGICVTPGQRLASASDFKAGDGTHVLNGYIYGSVFGEKEVNSQKVISVKAKNTSTLVPKEGDIVFCRITKVNPRFATASILCVGDVPLSGAFGGMIRVQDVRLTEVDKVQIYLSFRPGDIVRAKVLSLGDKRYYYLSTQQNDLGVIGAQCALSGVMMVPISWEQMQCPKTNIKEYRKVAKVE